MEQDKKQAVEELGIVFEQFGRSPMESRVFALLLLSEPPYQSFDDIRTFLGASKSAVSNALNTYIKEGVVDYITFSGDRKRYFKINPVNWHKQLAEGTKNLTALNTSLEKVILYRKDSKHLEFNEALINILAFQKFLNQKIGEAIDEWLSK